MPYLQTLPDGSLLLKLFVQPRASKNEIAGLHGDALKLRLTSPPVEGRANKAAVAYLARLLKVPKSSLTIRSGAQSRHKEIVIAEEEESRVREVLDGKAGAEFRKTRQGSTP